MKNKILVCLALSFSSGVFAGSEMMSSLFNQDSSAIESPGQGVESYNTEDETASVSSPIQDQEEAAEISLMNFKTGERETFLPVELSEEKAREFVPPIEKSQMTFNEFIDLGKEPHIALMMTYMFLERELEESNTLPE